MADHHIYLVVATVYGLVGAVLSASYYFCPRLRDEPAYHAFTLVLATLAALAATTASSLDFRNLAAFHFGARFFLFLAAGLCYAPALVFIALHRFESLLERALTPGSREAPPREPRTHEECWRRARSLLEALAADPTDGVSRERLADLYALMGFPDSAVYEYRKTAEWLERGYAHGHVLYKAARLLVEVRGDTASAVILLRRIIRLYPKSYFAAYARRVLNGYEAHRGVPAETGNSP